MSNTPVNPPVPVRGFVPRRAAAHLLPTLIDRLRDDSPRRNHEAPGEYTVSRAQMREIIQRDLAYLLNCTNIDDRIDRGRYPEAAASTVNYGVPALTGAYVASQSREDVESGIRRAILDFEPRLIPGSLSVMRVDNVDNVRLLNNLSFEIRGMIRMTPYPLEFMVQVILDPETSRLKAAVRRG
jgi:type VI secretion system protein ImpF